MPSILVEDSGHVLSPDAARARGMQAYFPSVVALGPGHLLASFDMGTDMEAPDVRTWVSRSIDGGRTWSAPACIYNPSELGYPASTLGRVSALRDGTLVGLVTVCDRSHTGLGLANPETEGFVDTRFGTVFSTDTGAAWSGIRWIDPPIAWNAFETCSPIHEVSDTRWILPTSIWRRWDGDCAPGMKAVAFVSEDRGATWTRCVDVANQWDARVASWEQKLTRLSDGRWMAVCWAFSYAEKKSLRNRYCFSDNDGASFGPAHEAPIDGETCTPLSLADGRVLFVYRRTGVRGLWAHLARIDGENWATLADAPLWGTQRSSYGALSDNKLEEMSTLQFGYPQCALLHDGAVFVVFWCVEDGTACIRWLRLRIAE